MRSCAVRSTSLAQLPLKSQPVVPLTHGKSTQALQRSLFQPIRYCFFSSSHLRHCVILGLHKGRRFLCSGLASRNPVNRAFTSACQLCANTFCPDRELKSLDVLLIGVGSSASGQGISRPVGVWLKGILVSSWWLSEILLTAFDLGRTNGDIYSKNFLVLQHCFGGEKFGCECEMIDIKCPSNTKYRYISSTSYLICVIQPFTVLLHIHAALFFFKVFLLTWPRKSFNTAGEKLVSITWNIFKGN